ncbi:transposase family protein [Streptomyces sp. NPDC057460]|uniref:transposase family protein n=1 Tax=Streptomyces sp. NPDC057460 TaxID=3346141 RepID=UPI00368FFDCA
MVQLLVTLVHLRLGLPHAASAEPYGVDRSTVSAAIRVVCPLPAARTRPLGLPEIRCRNRASPALGDGAPWSSNPLGTV